MPVEFTLPLTKLEQAVADARAHQQVMEAKVEDAKLTLKAAKTAWEESVGALNIAIDEMLRDKRQPSLFSDRDAGDAGDAGPTVTTGGPENPTPPTPAGETVTSTSGDSTLTTVEIIDPTETPTVEEAPFPGLPAITAGQPSDLTAASITGPSWRSDVIAQHLDGPGTVFDALDVFGVTTLGGLADALVDGMTFNLSAAEVADLREAIEDVSQEDERPIKFDRETGEVIKVTVKEKVKAVEPEPQPAAEPVVEPAKKKRGRKPKAKAEPAPVAAVVEPAGEAGEAEPVEPDPVEPAEHPAGFIEKDTSFDDL